MPLEVISGSDALKARSAVSKYPDPNRDPERYIPYPTIAHEAPFRFDHTDRIFTIGSCFARYSERALANLGAPVISALVDDLPANENIVNKYTSRSIVDDLRLALGLRSDFNRTIYGDERSGYFNLTFGGTGALKGQPREQVQELTRRYFDNLAKIRSATAVIITLGLVEVWYDRETETYLNIPPPPLVLKKHASRFQLHVLSYDDLLADLESIRSMLTEHVSPNIRMLVTVSPVPLHATFRGHDVLQANCYSKSVQRAAVEAFRLAHPGDVSYFPSYEMVSLAAPDVAWGEKDYRHVRLDLVERVMRKVMSCYLVPGSYLPSKEELRGLNMGGKFSETESLLDSYLTASGKKAADLPVYAQFYYAQALAKRGRTPAATEVLKNVIRLTPHHGPAVRLLDHLQLTQSQRGSNLPKRLLARLTSNGQSSVRA